MIWCLGMATWSNKTMATPGLPRRPRPIRPHARRDARALSPLLPPHREKTMANLWIRKSIAGLKAEAAESNEHGLKRTLTATNLVMLGIGAVIGAGFFVL